MTTLHSNASDPQGIFRASSDVYSILAKLAWLETYRRHLAKTFGYPETMSLGYLRLMRVILMSEPEPRPKWKTGRVGGWSRHPQ